jgi:CheY-like chemotaxis protein
MGAMVRGPTPCNILLVEDDPNDVELTRRALQRAKLQNRLWIVTDGEQALAFLRREGQHRGVPRPDLMLLDLRLPHLDGRDVLLRIREEPRWRRLSVIVLTASDAEHEQLATLAADGFLTKPVDFARLEAVIRGIAGLGWAIVKTAAAEA